MTVTLKEEIADARSARNTEGSRAYTRAFRLETSLQSEGPYEVGSHASLPVIGDTYPSDANAYCHDIQIDNSDPWKGWIATYEYSDRRQITTAATAGTGVIDEITYQLNSQIYQDEIEEARKVSAGGAVGPLKAVMNPAGTKFPTPLLSDFASLVFRIQFNMTFVPQDAFTYLNSINDSAINIYGVDIPKGKAKFQGVSIGKREYRGVDLNGNLITYHPVTYEIHARPSGWQTKKKNEGWMEKKTVGDNPTVVKDAEGVPVMEVALLDDNGAKLLKPTEDNATFSEYVPYPELNFKLLIGVD